MKIYPAIDLKDNQCVRLIQGDFNKETVYSKSPLEVAKRFELEGAQRIHVIDLNGAESGELVNKPTIKRLIETLSVPIQVGGGIRSVNQARELLEMGVERVILGTLALEDIDAVGELVKVYKGRIVVSIDARNLLVQTYGWQTSTAVHVFDFIKELEACGVQSMVYTDIETDGMMAGTNVEHLKKIKAQTSMRLIASGGIASLDDIKRLCAMGLEGVIVGKALYEGVFTVKEAKHACKTYNSLS